jgi:hypothetical protein
VIPAPHRVEEILLLEEHAEVGISSFLSTSHAQRAGL